MIFFFFQAEDGIRDKLVTGVQTCALPISLFSRRLEGDRRLVQELVEQRLAELFDAGPIFRAQVPQVSQGPLRSEERRVGKSVDLGGRRIIKKKKKKYNKTETVATRTRHVQ